MPNNLHRVQSSVSSTHQCDTSDSSGPLQQDPESGHDHWQVDQDHYVIHDMIIADPCLEACILTGDGTRVLNMIEELEDIVSSLLDPSSDADSSNTPKEPCNPGSIHNESSRDSGPGNDTSGLLGEASLGSAVNDRLQNVPLATQQKIANLHEAHPWHPGQLVSNPAETPYIKDPEWRHGGIAHELDGTVDIDQDTWSTKALAGDVEEDTEETLEGMSAI